MADEVNRRAKSVAREARAAVVCLLVIGAGTWLLARGLAWAKPTLPGLSTYALSGAAAGWIALAATVTGVGLLVAAVGLSVDRAWAWLLAALLAVAACAIAVLVWALAGGIDGAGLALALAALFALAAPSVRLDYLGDGRADV